MQFSVLVRGKGCWASHHGLPDWLFLLDCGGEKGFYLLKQRVASTHPASCSFFLKSRCFSGIKSYLLFLDLYGFERCSVKARHLFILWLFPLQLPSEDSPNKRLTLWAFQQSGWRRRFPLWCAGNPHWFCWYIILFNWVWVPGTSPMGEADE